MYFSRCLKVNQKDLISEEAHHFWHCYVLSTAEMISMNRIRFDTTCPFVPIITGQPILRLLFMMMPTELTGLEPPLEIELAFGCFTQCGVGEIKFLKIKS
jgi:hypothetical protein